MRTAAAIAVALLAHCAAHAQSNAPPIPESKASGIGYKSVREALEALKTQPGMEITTTKPEGWIIAHDPKSYVLWSFTPPGHYAHPAAVRRAVRQSGTDVVIEMNALCESEKPNCDKLWAEFEQLNAAMRKDIQQRLAK
jgi:hypothetical protein